ncbi:MAG: class I SAM-dependent methyltransferase [Gammaproteobacteria bacterium]
MLEKTDERYVPWSDDLCTGYEHVHRYLLAQKYVQGLKVLDLASGEGYGSWLLSHSAAKVIGIDISDESIHHANEVYKKSNLTYIPGSIINIPIHEDNSFDVITCFEALEHIIEHEQLLKEVTRLLKPNGQFIVSTPNKPVYSENGTRQNPYHLKELDFAEFEDLLKTSFKNVFFYGQKSYATSKIFPIDNSTNAINEHLVLKDNTSFSVSNTEDELPRYFIAIASNEVINDKNNKSYLIDISERSGYIKWEYPEIANPQPLTVKRRLKNWLRKMRSSLNV